LVPAPLRILLKHISPATFKVVDWQSALKDGIKTSGQYATGSGVNELKQDIVGKLPKSFTFEQTECAATNPETSGQNILRLYFWQIFTQQTHFLDLRPSRFQAQTDDEILWKPNGLLFTYSIDFLVAIRKLYKAFFSEDENNEEAIVSAAKELGLILPSFSRVQTNDLLELLKCHFGEGRTGKVLFSLEKFEESFNDLFLFLKENKVRLSSDFLFLGVYLLTLYINLDKVDIKLSPSDAIKEFM